MKQLGLSYFTDIHLTVLGLAIFFTFFVCVCLWAYRKSGSAIYQRIEKFPLQDGE